MNGRGAVVPNESLWEAEMDKSKNKLTIAQRTDRYLLVRL